MPCSTICRAPFDSVYSGHLVPVPSDRYERYHGSAPRGTTRPLQRYHRSDILNYGKDNQKQYRHFEYCSSFHIVHFCYLISILATSSTFFILLIFSMACFSSLEESTSENMRFFAQAFLPPLAWACFLSQASPECYRQRNHLWLHCVHS